MLAVAGNETTRNSITHGMIAFSQQPRPVGAVQEGAPGDRRRRDHPLGHAGVGVPAHRARGHRAGRRADQEGPAGGDVLPLGQLRRRGLRGPAHVQHPARPEPARRLRRHRRALLHRRQPGPDDDQPDLQRGRRPHARSQADRRARAATVGVAQRHQALAGRLHRRRSAQVTRAVAQTSQDQGGFGWTSVQTKGSRLSPMW